MPSTVVDPVFSIELGQYQESFLYKAPSSLELSPHCESPLLSPSTMSETTSLPTKSTPNIGKEPHIQLSPSSDSPFPLFEDDENEFGASKYAAPMKQRNSHHHSPSESTYPLSPYNDHYWGSFGVSATASAGPSNSSPSAHASPDIRSVSGISTDGQRSRQQTPGQNNANYAVHASGPILIAPNPSGFRTMEPYGHTPIHSNQSLPRSQVSPRSVFLDSTGSLQAGRKRKSPELSIEDNVLLYSTLSHEERLLLKLTEQDLPWKDVAKRFNEETGKSMKVPALQMRKKRLVEKLRVWTDTEERALTIAWEEHEKSKWESIAQNMLNHGCTEKWSKEAVQRRWIELHPDGYIYPSQYELHSRDQGHKGIHTWSDGKDFSGVTLRQRDAGPMLCAVPRDSLEYRSRARSLSASRTSQSSQSLQAMKEQQHNS